MAENGFIQSSHCKKGGALFLYVLSAILASILCGCGAAANCDNETPEQVAVVLTFDDGPLAADQSLEGASANSVELLQPLGEILATLDRRQVRAAFFVEGSGNAEIGEQVEGIFGDGLRMIHEGNHVLGYHAFDHDPAIWSQTFGPPLYGRVPIREDLDRLVDYIDLALESVDAEREDWFTPIFRQPFGGSGISRSEAQTVVQERGWVYHGFMIDSVDWTDNTESDPALADGLPFETEAERVEFVRRRIRSGIFRNWDREVIDVLLHVNAFTAANLDNWIDEIETAYSQKANATILFDVPECYITTPDARVDRTLIEDLIRGL